MVDRIEMAPSRLCGFRWRRFRPVQVARSSVESVIGLDPYNIVANHREANTSFVFSRGDGIEVIGGFKLGGVGHDAIALPSSDFQSFAAVLHNTGDVNGSAFITDARTGDAIRLAGITTAELKAHPKDFSFYG